MSGGRIALIAAGLLVAAGALFLVVRGFRGTGAAPGAAPAAEADKPAAGAAGHGKEDKTPPPRWQSFLRPAERTAPPRPIVRIAQGLPSPFDRLPSGGGAAVARRPAPENPGLRLEGISAGARPVALISGHAVREGDAVSGFRVARIGRSDVTLAGPGGRLDLKLGTPPPAAPAANTLRGGAR